MLEKLLGFIDPEDPFVRLDSLCFEELDAVLDVSVLDYDCTETWARWRLRARDVREYRVTSPMSKRRVSLNLKTNLLAAAPLRVTASRPAIVAGN